MPYTFGTKGVMSGRQIAPGLPTPKKTTNNIVLQQTFIADKAYGIMPLNDNFQQLAYWENFTNTANSVTAVKGIIGSNNLTPLSGSVTGNNTDGFPVLDGNYVATVLCDSTKSQILTIIDFTDISNPRIASQTNLESGGGAITLGASSRIYPAGDSSKILSLTRTSGDTSGNVTVRVHKVDDIGMVTLDSTGNSLASTNYSHIETPSSYGGIGIDVVPLGAVGIYEHWIMSSDFGATYLLSYNTVTKMLSTIDLSWGYASVLVAIRVSQFEFNIVAYFNWQNGGSVNTNNALYDSFLPKKKKRLIFSSVDGSYSSNTNQLTAMNEGMTIDGYSSSYWYRFRRSHIFGNYPATTVGIRGNGTTTSASYRMDNTSINYDDNNNYSYMSSHNAIIPISGLGVTDTAIPLGELNYSSGFLSNHVWSLTNGAFVATANPCAALAGFDLLTKSPNTGEYANESGTAVKRLAMPAGLSTALWSTKLIPMQDRFIILNKPTNDTTSLINVCHVYPR